MIPRWISQCPNISTLGGEPPRLSTKQLHLRISVREYSYRSHPWNSKSISSSSCHHNHSSQIKLRSLLGKYVRHRYPKWQKENWKCPFKPTGDLALTSPKQGTGGLATTFSGSHTARAWVSWPGQPPTSAMGAGEKVWERRGRGGWALSRVPAFWLCTPPAHWQVVP